LRKKRTTNLRFGDGEKNFERQTPPCNTAKGKGPAKSERKVNGRGSPASDGKGAGKNTVGGLVKSTRTKEGGRQAVAEKKDFKKREKED